MTQWLRDGNGVEWACTELPNGGGDDAAVGRVVYSCQRTDRPDDDAEHIFVPSSWDLGDQHVRSIAIGDLLTGASATG